MFKKIVMRILITIIGIMFILYGIVWSMLGIFGEKSTGLITDVRREMGELNDSRSGRYSYSIGYVFEIPNGDTINGFTKQISDGVFIKHPNTEVSVRYLKIFPYINSLEQNAGFDFGKIIMILIGSVLVVIVNKSW